MPQYAFYFNSGNCVGCKACQVACKESFNLPSENLYRKVYNYQGGSWRVDGSNYFPEDVFGYFISISCNHCEDPVCAHVCPTGAMQKDADTGIVWTDHNVCIGCRSCQMACPYSAPTYNEDEGFMMKCDMCKAEVQEGNKPICVRACPLRALNFGLHDELVAEFGAGDMEIEPLPENTTNPSTVLIPHPKAQKTGQGTGSVVNFEEELS